MLGFRSESLKYSWLQGAFFTGNSDNMSTLLRWKRKVFSCSPKNASDTGWQGCTGHRWSAVAQFQSGGKHLKVAIKSLRRCELFCGPKLPPGKAIRWGGNNKCSVEVVVCEVESDYLSEDVGIKKSKRTSPTVWSTYYKKVKIPSWELVCISEKLVWISTLSQILCRCFFDKPIIYAYRHCKLNHLFSFITHLKSRYRKKRKFIGFRRAELK